jgi:hypothetical protein
MPFHGIISRVTGLWFRVITGTDLFQGDKVLEEMEGGAYRPAFLEHFFPGKYRVEVYKTNDKYFFQNEGNRKRRFKAHKAGLNPDSVSGEVISFTSQSDHYKVRIKGDRQGWLGALRDIGLIIGNSPKMAKRLIEIVRIACAWTFRTASEGMAIDIIAHDGPDTDVDGISAISQSFFFECIDSNTQAPEQWRRSMKRAVKSGKITVVSLRILTPMGLIKGNALVLPDWMMEGYEVRTFRPNFKGELKTNGWYWATIEPSYGAIPVKSDDLTHSIYRGVKGLYDDETLMSSFRGMLNEFFKDLKSGKRSEWLERLAENADDILHDEEAFDKYANNRGSVARIQLAIAQMAAVGVPLTASQTLMFFSVNGLRTQLLGSNKPNQVWTDKSRHWFPVPWAYAAHVMTQEALRAFGFHISDTERGFYHQDTHCFVVPGKFFAENFENHGGPDLDDTIKVHVRHVVTSEGMKLMGFLLRNPNDFGEWSMIEIDQVGPVYHQYGDTPPVVELDELNSKVPQWTKLKGSLNIGQLPCVSNPRSIGDVFSREDDLRSREAAMMMPGGVGPAVIVKMLWYANTGGPMTNLCAPNEEIIDALQQGLGTSEDMSIIKQWSKDSWLELSKKGPIDYFWCHTRMSKDILRSHEFTITSPEESTWLSLHMERDRRAQHAIEVMTNWLNSTIVMPDALADVVWTDEENAASIKELRNLNKMARFKSGWSQHFVDMLVKSDEENGEEYTDRKILRLAHASIYLKKQYSKANLDRWLYSISKHEVQPVDWYIRAMSRLQDGTYNW